jgi:hypothetical protein
MDLRESIWSVCDKGCIVSGEDEQLAIMKTVLKILMPQQGKLLTSPVTSNFMRSTLYLKLNVKVI